MGVLSIGPARGGGEGKLGGAGVPDFGGGRGVGKVDSWKETELEGSIQVAPIKGTWGGLHKAWVVILGKGHILTRVTTMSLLAFG